MKSQSLHPLRICFPKAEETRETASATILDPRFKDNFFVGNIIKATTKEWVLKEMAKGFF